MTDFTSTPSVDPRHFRDVLSNYPTGVCVVTAIADDGEPVAMVVGTFASVSLDPPLISFLPTKDSYIFSRIKSAPSFTVNVLAHDQEVLCRQLSRPVPDKLKNVPWRPSANGAPLLENVIAHVDCDLRDIYDGGDHHIVLGEVTDLGVHRHVAPLIFFQGGFGGFAPPAFMMSTDHHLASAVRTLSAVQTELEDIAHEFGGDVDLLSRIGDDAANAAASAFRPSGEGDFLGARYPLIPPFGEHFVAAGGEDGTERWLSRGRGLSAEDLAHYRRRIDLVRERGWTYTARHTEGSSNPTDTIRQHTDFPTPATYRQVIQSASEARSAYPIDAVEADSIYEVTALVAPVRSPDGDTLFVLRVSFVGLLLSGAQLQARGKKLLDRAQYISTKLTSANRSGR